jgi:site-specific DNA-methyltransferase (adenine-specific)
MNIETRLLNTSSEAASVACPELVGRIALVVTSPPYHNAISYESHSKDSSANYRPRQGIDYANEYLPLMKRVWDESWTMLRPGGYLAINVGSVLDNGRHYPLPQDTMAQLCLQEPKWMFDRNILWHKVTAGVKRAGSVIKHQLPGYWYPNIMTEHVIVVHKPGSNPVANQDTPDEWWENVWDLAPVPPRTIDHPAPFPEDLPHRLIRMLTNTGDWILDPFNGAGSTTKAAHDLNRNSVGFDLEPKYIEYARNRLLSPSTVRSTQLRVAPVNAADFVPGRSKGKTRHGAGLKTRRRK